MLECVSAGVFTPQEHVCIRSVFCCVYQHAFDSQKWCQARWGERRGAAPLSYDAAVTLDQSGGCTGWRASRQRHTAVGMTLHFCSGRYRGRASKEGQDTRRLLASAVLWRYILLNIIKQKVFYLAHGAVFITRPPLKAPNTHQSIRRFLSLVRSNTQYSVRVILKRETKCRREKEKWTYVQLEKMQYFVLRDLGNSIQILGTPPYHSKIVCEFILSVLLWQALCVVSLTFLPKAGRGVNMRPSACACDVVSW